jgi:hypothetical protein
MHEPGWANLSETLIHLVRYCSPNTEAFVELSVPRAPPIPKRSPAKMLPCFQAHKAQSTKQGHPAVKEKQMEQGVGEGSIRVDEHA